MPRPGISAESALFPARPERAQWDDWLTEALGAAAARVAEGSVSPTLDLDAFRHELLRFDFAAPTPLGPLLDWTIAQLEHGVTQLTNPRYFGLFNPAPTFPAQCADRIAA